MSKDTSPLAFPSHGSMGEVVAPGMTLRQWYAGMALQGYLAAHAGPDVSIPMPEHLVKRAFECADFMLAEGSK